MSFTKKQHYISKYVLKRFANDKGKIDAVLLPSTKKISTNINDICVQNDFYEDKSKDGEYINRNRTENKFAFIESELANKIEELFQILSEEDYYEVLRRMYSTGAWEGLSIYLMLHLTLVMIRTPRFKNIVFDSDELPLEIKQVFYKNFLFGREEAKVLAENQFNDNELSLVLKSLEGDLEFEGGLNALMNHLVNNYFVEIYKAPKNKKFYLSDNPVIVNEIQGIDYFMPLSPDIAIVMKNILNYREVKISILPEASQRMVDGINKVQIGNATKVIIVQNITDEDFDFIKENVSL